MNHAAKLVRFFTKTSIVPADAGRAIPICFYPPFRPDGYIQYIFWSTKKKTRFVYLSHGPGTGFGGIVCLYDAHLSHLIDGIDPTFWYVVIFTSIRIPF